MSNLNNNNFQRSMFGLSSIDSTNVNSSDIVCDTLQVTSAATGPTVANNDISNSIATTEWVNQHANQDNLKYVPSTGLYTGGQLDIVDASHYSISDGTGVHYDTLTRIHTDVSWSGNTSVAVLDITQAEIYILIDQTGSIIEQYVHPTNDEYRNAIYLGHFHSDGTTLRVADKEPFYVGDVRAQLGDLLEAMGGFIKVSGNIISPNGPSLAFVKSTGQLFGNGINFHVDPQDPNLESTPALDSSVDTMVINYEFQDGTEEFLSGPPYLLDPNNYDVAGVKTAVGNNKFTTQRIYLSPGNELLIQYGQFEYNSLAVAEDSINSEAFVESPHIAHNYIQLAWIIMKKGTTDLNSATDCTIINTGLFAGTISAGYSTGTLQNAYENSTTTPQITVSSVNGAMQVKGDGSVPSIMDLIDSSGSTVMQISNNGTIFSNDTIVGNIISCSALDTPYLVANDIDATSSSENCNSYANLITGGLEICENQTTGWLFLGSTSVLHKTFLRAGGGVNVENTLYCNDAQASVPGDAVSLYTNNTGGTITMGETTGNFNINCDTTIASGKQITFASNIHLEGSTNGRLCIGKETACSGNNQVSLGYRASFNPGSGSTAENSICIGSNAGANMPASANANTNVLIGSSVASNITATSNRAYNLIAIGNQCMENATVDSGAIAIGTLAAQGYAGQYGTYIGYSAGQADGLGETNGSRNVAIGNEAGTNGLDAYSVAIGYRSAWSNVANSICLNASGSSFNSDQAGFFVKPIRNLSTPPDSHLRLHLNTSTNEIITLADDHLFAGVWLANGSGSAFDLYPITTSTPDLNKLNGSNGLETTVTTSQSGGTAMGKFSLINLRNVADKWILFPGYGMVLRKTANDASSTILIDYKNTTSNMQIIRHDPVFPNNLQDGEYVDIYYNDVKL